MKKWKILNKTKELDKDELIKILLENRGIKTKKEIEEFLDPKLSDITASGVGIDKKQLEKTIERIRKAILAKEQIVIFGDYDVDGICGTAILWETLNDLGAKVMPYIPYRMDEGYGLSIQGIENFKSQIPNPKLIITVDNGIVANDAVDFANENGIDVIITDHHVPSQKVPNAHSIVHTTKICGTGVAYLLAQEFKIQNSKFKINENTHLELVALATIADLVPLKEENRTFVKFGLEELRRTKRTGLLALIKEAGINKELINTYEIGHIIAPRLNAMGRLEYAMDSLRLLCTNDDSRAKNLAYKLGVTNRRRQEMTIDSFEHARLKVKSQSMRQAQDKQLKVKSLIFVGHESYQQGVVGLIAGRLVEEFYRPTIVVSKGEKISRASARSISGFNIIEFIRNASKFLVDAGGHPMAAGFTVETEKLSLVQEKLEKLAEKMLNEDMLTQSLRVDCEIKFSLIDNNLYDAIQTLAPFGMGNLQPSFVSKKVIIEDIRLVGADRKHLKLKLSQLNSPIQFDAIGFGMGKMSEKIRIGDRIDLVYQIEQNEWPARHATQGIAGGNGNSKLQLKIKDFR